jgi:DNA-binding response OmpR family regulator
LERKRTMRILVAEDDEVLAKALARGLRREGMAVDIAPDGDETLARARSGNYDVVVLDRDLPGIHGDDVCRALVSERSRSRVLMLTAASSLRARVAGLGLGADDYLSKPFEFAELVARIRAVARRPAVPAPCLEYGELSVDPSARTASRAGRRLALTTKELAVLERLLAAQGNPISAERLLEDVWDDATDPFTTTVKTTIGRLRAKLGDPPVIETIREAGYRIGGS